MKSSSSSSSAPSSQSLSPPPPPPHTHLMPTKIDSLIGGAMRPSRGSKTHTQAIYTIDTHFRYAAIWAIGIYTTLVISCYYIASPEQIVRLEGVEQNSAIMAMALISLSMVSRIIQMGGHVDRGKKLNLSGVFIGGLTVQIIALFTDTLLAFFPTPLVIDPVLGTRVHVLRWCEWCPCAAYMTFMMEGSDLYWSGKYPPRGYLLSKYIHAAMQGGAVFLGLCFPFCPGFRTWMTCMIVACILYLTNYPRMNRRKREIPATLYEGATIQEKERYNSAKIALRLRFVTTLVWSIIVGLYFASSVIGPKCAPPESFLRNPAANMMCECFFDVLSKVLFLQVILEVHSAVFDPYARMERRMEELHQLLATVWESSTDMIAISVRVGGDSGASILLSPAFFSLGKGKDAQREQLSKEQENGFTQRKSILYEMAASAFKLTSANNTANGGEENSPIVNSEMIINAQETGFSLMDTVAGDFIADESTLSRVRAVSDILIKAWTIESRDHEFSHNIPCASVVQLDHISKKSIRVEAKVSRLDENSLIVIVRDISERVRAFEAEKQVLLETTTRVKDEEANRFTRHEVKNGLLSAIGLYESLCEAHKVQLMKAFNDNGEGIGSDANGSFQHIFRCMSDLGKCLHDTLDTILVEAMTRDLVHDLYRPEREKIYLPSLLSGFTDEATHSLKLGGGDTSRFTIDAQPSPFPMINTDPRLLRYLHRQAVSNACKFGKTGGSVLTEIIYNEQRHEVQINVLNLPGRYHDRLVAMGSAAEALVFKKGYHLHELLSDEASGVTRESSTTIQSASSAWIIKKGAHIMKGVCSIKFNELGTEFSLTFPAKPLKLHQERRASDGEREVKKFTLPNGTWGIAIDDAKVQMKLLGKLFEFAGIQSDRIKLFGQSSGEIMTFVDYVVDFFNENEEDHVLLIADENLDVMDGTSKHMTMSGSQMVETIRSRLLPEQEKRLVALIRSANDSLNDVALYEARAHGFLPKAPIKKGEVLERLKPFWVQRCPELFDGEDSRSGRSLTNSFDSVSSFNVVTATPTDIFQTVHEIDELFTTGLVEENWENIWEKLHVLKGDLLSTFEVGSQVLSAVGMVDHFRELTNIIVRKERWDLLRRKILYCVHLNDDFEPLLTGYD